ncbi:MAG: hypothetical protein QM811_08510 [Pirellulales bacterium]
MVASASSAAAACQAPTHHNVNPSPTATKNATNAHRASKDDAARPAASSRRAARKLHTAATIGPNDVSPAANKWRTKIGINACPDMNLCGTERLYD